MSRLSSTSLSFASLFVLSGLMLGACAAEPGSGEKADATDETTQAFGLSDTRIVGSLDYGQTSASTSYTRAPRYRAYKFAGNAGDDVEVWVRSSNGDPVTWILDNDWKIVGKSDDASPSDTSSHIKVKLPANASATHYVVVRDYWLDPMSFRVQLLGTSSDFASGCNVDADCVKVSKTCCELGSYVAVKKGNEAAYRGSLACPTPLFCPAVLPKADFSMPQCNVAAHRCELVAPKDIACGGFTTNPHACPPRYSCIASDPTGDVPGKCFQFCGGIAGFACTDPNEECADNPGDGCVPGAGGADCGGICVPKN